MHVRRGVYCRMIGVGCLGVDEAREVFGVVTSWTWCSVSAGQQPGEVAHFFLTEEACYRCCRPQHGGDGRQQAAKNGISERFRTPALRLGTTAPVARGEGRTTFLDLVSSRLKALTRDVIPAMMP